mmetsp:Transcript_4653/g.11742  ORF Transcript_4653/g.11742 Transcript_4653/m.11742 type:complete len:245 (+) Transcript_4653:232-966(+)
MSMAARCARSLLSISSLTSVAERLVMILPKSLPVWSSRRIGSDASKCPLTAAMSSMVMGRSSGDSVMRSTALRVSFMVPDVSVVKESHCWLLVGRPPWASKSVPMSSPSKMRRILSVSLPLATTVLTPPWAASDAASILLAMPPRPIVDLCPISILPSGVKTLMRLAPFWSGGLSKTASTSVRRARPSDSEPAATRAESMSLSEKTGAWRPCPTTPVTTSFSLMTGTMPICDSRSIVLVRETKR